MDKGGSGEGVPDLGIAYERLGREKVSSYLGS